MDMIKKGKKLLSILLNEYYRSCLLKGVAPAVEHSAALKSYQLNSVIDVGANRGQFTTMIFDLFPNSNIIAFEPLAEPFRKLVEVTSRFTNIRTVNTAIGPEKANLPINVATRDDSSSLLQITAMQEAVFPQTGYKRTDYVEVAPMTNYVSSSDLKSPCLLKIDVQGFELQVLKGCYELISNVDLIYVETSFVELYDGQPFAYDIINYLHPRGFQLSGIYNLHYTKAGHPVQGDFLFVRGKASETESKQMDAQLKAS